MRKRARRGGGGRSFTEALDAAQKGDFEPLLGDRAEDWREFVREQLELGTNQFMLRIEIEDPASTLRNWIRGSRAGPSR